MFCVYCGVQLPDGAAFCSRCGKAQPGQSAVKQEIKNLSDRFLGTDGLLNKTFQAAKKGMREAAKQGQELYKQINSLQEGTDEEVNYISVTFPDPPSPEDCARYPGVTNLKPVTFRNRNNGSLQALSYPSMGINPGWWYQINGEILSGMGPAEKAVPYFEEGASFLNRNCMVWMGSLYGGGIGVQTNVFVAKEWYEKAASLGSNLAKLRLGRLYYDRLPVEYMDPELALINSTRELLRLGDFTAKMFVNVRCVLNAKALNGESSKTLRERVRYLAQRISGYLAAIPCDSSAQRHRLSLCLLCTARLSEFSSIVFNIQKRSEQLSAAVSGERLAQSRSLALQLSDKCELAFEHALHCFAFGSQDHMQQFGEFLRKRLRAGNESNFVKGFVTLSSMQVIGAMAILGPVQAALGNNELLYFKSVLDFTSAFIFATIYGLGIVPVGLVVLVYQGLFYVLATLFLPLMTADVIRELNAVGGVMSNGFLRSQLLRYAGRHHVRVILAPDGYSADNASGAAFWALWKERGHL